MSRIPLVPFAVAMIVGIAVGHHAGAVPLWLWIVATGVAATAAGVLQALTKRTPGIVYTLLLSAAFLAAGAARCHISDPRYDPHHYSTLLVTEATATDNSDPTNTPTKTNNTPHYLHTRLTAPPEPRQRSWRTEMEILSLDGTPCRGTSPFYLRRDSLAATLRYGDHLLIHTHIDPSRPFLYATSDHYIVTHRDTTSLRARSEGLRQQMLLRMQQGPMEPRYRGIAEALTLGWRADLAPDLRAQFRDAGIMHLLCVSGLHVGLLSALVGALLFWVNKERKGRILRGTVQIVVLWSYALLSGLAPATVRAALMFSLFIVSRMLGRRTDSLNLLAAAAIAMLAFNPLLLFDVGWQLSFSAVAGILLARPAIALFRNPFWQASVVSLAATLATLPVSLATFHQFHPYFLLANVLVVPFAGLLLGVSLLFLALPCAPVARLAEVLFAACDWLTSRIAHLPAASLANLNPSPLDTALLSAAIIFILVTINISLLRYQRTKNEIPC